MGILVSKDQDQNSKLTERINADLRARAAQSVGGGERKDPDLVEDSDYARDLKKTGRFSWVWFVLLAAVLIALVVIVLV